MSLFWLKKFQDRFVDRQNRATNILKEENFILHEKNFYTEYFKNQPRLIDKMLYSMKVSNLNQKFKQKQSKNTHIPQTFSFLKNSRNSKKLLKISEKVSKMCSEAKTLSFKPV